MILITSPKYDDGTEYLSYYSSLILKEINNNNIPVKNFEGKEANRGNVIKFLQKKNPKTLFINGHGDEKTLYGSHNLLLFSIEDISLLKNKLIYARACSAGAFLGEKIVENNNGCFIGYKYPFSFWIDQKHSATPSRDNTAKFYLEPSNEIMIFIINGRTAQQSHEKSKKMMIENMKKILKLEEKKEPGAMGMLQILWNNFDGQVLHGNPSARFEDN